MKKIKQFLKGLVMGTGITFEKPKEKTAEEIGVSVGANLVKLIKSSLRLFLEGLKALRARNQRKREALQKSSTGMERFKIVIDKK